MIVIDENNNETNYLIDKFKIRKLVNIRNIKRLKKGIKKTLQSAKTIKNLLYLGGGVGIAIIFTICMMAGLFIAIYGDDEGNISSADIVTVAKTQLGNEGGETYWKWYGFEERVSWCACFVSWCGEQCGYIEQEKLPKFAVCNDGVNWFKEKELWQDNYYIPKAGDIIFFDWEQDGSSDHVGIVERIDDTKVYTIEGNSNDSCEENIYDIGSEVIEGYGMIIY